MSDHPQGPDWWQASDYKWYPPQQVGQWGMPQYGPPSGYPGYPGVNPYDSRATTVLVLGILSLVVCPLVLSIAALSVGAGVRRDALAAGYPEPGSCKAGRICGMISLGLMVLLGALFVIGALSAGTRT